MRARPVLLVAIVAAMLVATPLTAVSAAPPVSPPGQAVKQIHVCQRGTDDVACNAIRAERTDPGTGRPMVYTADSGYTAAQLKAAYAIPGGGSASTVIAIVDAYDDPSAVADVVAYRSAMKLPPIETGCTVSGGVGNFSITPPSGSAGPCFVKVGQTGSTSSLPTFNSGWAQEISLDVDMASAVCPACSILLVEASSASLANLATAVTTASQFAGVKAISNSYGSAVGTDYSSASFPQYATAASKGIAVTVSTGDNAYGVSFPSTVPEAIAVGGTSLLMDSGKTTYVDENAWSGAGSGCSTSNKALSWQLQAACGTARPTADISAVADPATGVSVYYNGAWYVFGGTSVSAPIVGSWLALTGTYNATAGNTPSEYVYKQTWRDVSGGSNGTCSPTLLCSAVAGWDGPTGRGSIAPPSTEAPVLTSITVSPTSPSVPTGATQQFATVAKDQFGNLMSPSPTIAWSVSGCGNIDSAGLFMAGSAAAGPCTITATSGSVSGTASVAVTSTAPAPSFTISATPSSATVTRGGTANYAVTVTSVAEFTGSVALSVTPPSKTTAKFTPSSILFPGSGAKSSTLAVTTAKAGPRGTYTLTIKGTSGPLSVSTTVQLTIK